MKITCQACQAKYTIADDKVVGKVVKIRCKKCGGTIVVNGNDPSASASLGGEAGSAFDYAGQGAAANQWTVNVADGDQRTMTDHEILSAYQSGIVNDETFCWKDGMNDWLPLGEIDQLHEKCTATVNTAPQRTDPPGPEDVTNVQDSAPSMFGSGAGSSPRPGYAAVRPAAGDGNGAGAMTSPAASAVAARRAGGRAPGADLFGTAAQAGSEEDVMTSAPAGMPQAHEDPSKMTGQRNENSVLFSLSALTSKGSGPGQPAEGSEASGLIDIRQLSAQMGMGDEKKRSGIDDIMNLAGGGAFGPSLAAPVLSAPPVEEFAPQGEGAPTQGKSKALIFLALGAGALVIVAAVGGSLALMRKGAEPTDTDKTAVSAGPQTAVPSASIAMNAPPPSSTDTSATTSPPASATSTASAAATTSKTAAAATTKPTTAPTDTGAATTPPATAAPATAAAGGGADQPFNMGEAKARLASIAGSVQACKRGDLSGSGRVVVTFAPSGGAQSAVVSGPPFEGTPTGACVAGRFKGARVPPFTGSPFSVSKSFSIN